MTAKGNTDTQKYLFLVMKYPDFTEVEGMA